MTLPIASFESEKRWLLALGKSKGPFFLIGFEGAEERYLLERARERLQQQGLELKLQQSPSLQAHHSQASQNLSQLSLFETVSWQQCSYRHLEMEDESLWSNDPLRWIVTAAKIPKPLHLALAPSTQILSVIGEKSWQKTKRLQPWLQALAKSYGLELCAPTALAYCEQFNADRQLLRTEFERIAALLNYQGKVDMPGQQPGSASVWKWQELIYQRALAQAIDMVEDLLIAEPSGISITAFIRGQWQGLWQSLGEGSEPAEWKAKRLEQKRQIARRIGFARWKEGMLAISQAQHALKSARKPVEVLQVLCLQLCNLLT